MPGRDKKDSTASESAAKLSTSEPIMDGFDDIDALPAASAINISRPKTNLAVPATSKLGKHVVSLLIESSSIPSLDELDRVNRAESGANTPLMSVILAIIAKAGGSITIEELAPQVKKAWNRQLPSSPYNLEEFIYLIVRNSDSLRVTG
jgi:hypothetical protein